MNTSNIIGRKEEIRKLQKCYDSNMAQLVIVYGRRRVGKTYLVSELFRGCFALRLTGAYNQSKEVQLEHFADDLRYVYKSDLVTPSSWKEAFGMLRSFIESRPIEERQLIFIDEIPWMDSPKSDFLPSFEYFWNSFGAQQSNLMMIVCGSATAWMTENFADNPGGLFNRHAMRLYLRPFTLCETEEYLKSRHIEWSRYDIVECYMTMGGIPFYLSQLDEDLTYSANIDNLFFRQKGALWDEFRHLYRTLFRNSDIYVRVVEALSNKKSGMTRGEISAATKLPNNGDLTRVLQNLVDSDFVRQYHFFGNKRKNMLYQLCDNYTLFYYRFIKDNYGRDERYWTNTLDSPARKAWAGNAFELVCKSHIQQIKRKLGILGVLSQDSVCTIDRDYEMQLRNKIEAFRSCTKSRSALHLTMITTYGVQRNAHSGIMQSEVTMDDTKVRYPVDVELVHDGCKAIDGIISKVCASLGISVIKTCYKDARRFYLELVKLKKKGGKPLGRPPKNPPSPEILAKMAKAVGERNEVECSFGTGKRIYRANNIRAKLPETARCWTGMCYFVKNVMKFLRELCHALIEIWHMLLAQVTCGGNVCYPMVLAKY